MDVGVWLRSLGLEQYETAFRENEVDGAVLPNLTTEDLKDLGVRIVGHRRKLLDAAAALRADANEESARLDALPTADSAAKDSAERRQMTVMFVDLVGSTALSSCADPEDMRKVISAYQKCVAGIVNRFDGYVAQYMGDGILCYFGWPKAHEDDAERAVRAALVVMKAVAALKGPDGKPLSGRAGIASGLVVVGEGTAHQGAAVGETLNLAARLQGLAGPGEVVVAEATRRLFGDVFELVDLGVHRLKGLPEPIIAFAVLNERATENRFEARSSAALSGMVGRDHELALILERWRLANAGEGQLVLLSGEAGIGKSRLSRALIDTVAKEPHTRLTYQCSPYHTDSPLFPIVQNIIFLAGIKSVDSNDDKLNKLEALIFDENDRPLIAALLGLQYESRYGELSMTPQQQRAGLLQALVARVIALSRDKPVLVILEDAHWIDASTLEFLDLCLDQVPPSRVLIVITARPTFVHGFGGRPIVTKLALNRLGRGPIKAIVNNLSGGKTLPTALLDEIIDKTDGVPLFVEELTKMVLESGELREVEFGYELAGALSDLLVPATLHASLMARLDRLQPVKEVAQIAACIGREFEYGLLKAITPVDDAALRDALDRLIAAELIFARGLPPEARYTFKHALVRDAAYESVLKTRRQIIHGRLLDALEGQGTTAPELLAHHATRAGMNEKAISYSRQAGIAATMRPAYHEAIGHFTTALSLVRQGGNGRAQLESELDLQVLLAQALVPKVGWIAEPTAQAFARALKIVEQVGETPNRFPVLYGNWTIHHARGESSLHLALAKDTLALAEQQEDNVPRLVAHRLAGVSHFAVGKLRTAAQHLDLALSLYQPAEHGDVVHRFGLEPGITTLCFLYIVYWLLGFPDKADGYAQAAARAADQTGHVNTSANTSFLLSTFATCSRDESLLERHSCRLQALSEEHDLALFQSFSDIAQGILLTLRGQKDGTNQFQRGFSANMARGARFFMPNYVVNYARAVFGLSRVAAARNEVSIAHELLSAMGERWAEAEIYRLDGDLCIVEGTLMAGVARYQKAIEIARQQEAKSLELRATVSLARHWASSGERHKAQDLLTPVYNWFTEGVDKCDLREAKALLDTLAS